jgi:hypothetical protein
MMVRSVSVVSVATAALLAGNSHGFVPATTGRSVKASSATQLNFGIPKFLTPREETPEGEKAAAPEGALPKKELSWKGVLQLVTAGAGAPFLGDFEGVDEETGKFMFSLEANNLYDDEGKSKQTAMPYFEQGWVDPEDEKRAQEGFKWPWEKK